MTSEPSPQIRTHRKRLWAYRIMSLAGSLLLVLVFGELLVRMIAPQHLNGRFSEMTEKGLIVNRANWQAEHSLGDINVVYRFNEHHLRGGSIGEGKRVLVLGDSWTFGWLLHEEDTYVQQLGAHCDKEYGPGTFTVLNGGRGGWGTAEYVAFLEDHGEAIRPDMVVVFLNFADIHRSVGSKHYRLSNAHQAVVERNARTRSVSRTLTDHFVLVDWLLAHSHLYHLARNTLARTSHRAPPPTAMASEGPPSNVLPSDTSPSDASRKSASLGNPASKPDHVALGQALFHRMHDWCQTRGITLVVLTTGYNSYHRNPFDEAFLQHAPAFFANEGIPFHDLTPEVTHAVNGRWADFLIPGDGHPNAAGASLITAPAWHYLAPFFRKLHGRKTS